MFTRHFWSGFSSALNLYGRPSRPVPIHHRRRSAADALKSDWEKIGKDMETAIAKEHAQQETPKSTEECCLSR
jgi:hypothetical protein